MKSSNNFERIIFFDSLEEAFKELAEVEKFKPAIPVKLLNLAVGEFGIGERFILRGRGKTQTIPQHNMAVVEMSRRRGKEIIMLPSKEAIPLGSSR